MEWRGDHLRMLDQRSLPGAIEWIELRTAAEAAKAIRDMVVRGAPAIGIAAAYGMVLTILSGEDWGTAREALAASRPTAINLFWALDKMAAFENAGLEAALAQASTIEREDYEANLELARLGAALLPDRATVLTICNTGALATGGHGTALGIIRTGYELGRISHVYACETRPRLQGMKLTAWELLQEGIPFQLIPDSASASLMAAGKVQAVVVGADRIAANGDTANKIGTLMLAVLCSHYSIPFIVAAPRSTISPSTLSGKEIPIEEREASEITHIGDSRLAPELCPVFNPAFDVTPAGLITHIVTEKGVYDPPYNFTWTS